MTALNYDREFHASKLNTSNTSDHVTFTSSSNLLRTVIVIFEGIMDRFLYTDILDTGMLPFITEVYPFHHHFMQDNDPKHTSIHARNFMEENGVNCWETPPESPDSNPIENHGTNPRNLFGEK